MNDLEFVDTNVLIYAHDQSAGKKRVAAEQLLARLWDQANGCLSLQVLVEFYSAATAKLSLPGKLAEDIITDLSGWTIHRLSYDDVIAASQMHRRHKLHWRDALMLQSALAMGCSILWTEDLSHGQTFGSLTIRNPFRPAP